MTPAIALAALAALALAAIGAIVFRSKRAQASPTISSPRESGESRTAGAENYPPYANEATQSVEAEYFKLAFGVGRFDYNIVGEHAEVLRRIGEELAESVHQREYFPRRPMLLPRLLKALNDTESTRQELVNLILEDPALAGSVLQRSNTPYYRVSPEPVDSLDRAVQVLGTEGLRSLLATAILQPVFRLPKGYFDNFAPVTWEQAQRCAAAAEKYAGATHQADPFVAQLLGLLEPLARIVLFRLAMDMYREKPHLLPRAEVFIRAIQAHGSQLAALIARTWELSDPSVKALDEQEQRVSPAHMSALGRAVYFGNLCGGLALLGARNFYSADGAHALLTSQGLDRHDAYAMWHAASLAGSDQ
ncbi:MAG TPA: HDOD domain-containing protein [Steroidobacter sp.]